MKIEQTQAFRLTVDHMVKLGNDHKFDKEFPFSEFLSRTKTLRGAEFARKAAAKANQRLRCKLYVA